MAKRNSEARANMVAVLASFLIISICGLVGAGLQLSAQADEIAATNAHAASLQAKLDWFGAELRDRPILDVPAAEAVIDEEDE